MRGRKQFHKGKSIHKDSDNTKQHTQSKEELATALTSLENPIFQLYGDTLHFSSIQSKSKTAKSISNNYRKGQQSKMVLNSGEVFLLRNQVIYTLSYQRLPQEETSLFLNSFNFVSYLSLINIFGGKNKISGHLGKNLINHANLKYKNDNLPKMQKTYQEKNQIQIWKISRNLQFQSQIYYQIISKLAWGVQVW